MITAEQTMTMPTIRRRTKEQPAQGMDTGSVIFSSLARLAENDRRSSNIFSLAQTMIDRERIRERIAK